MGRCARLAVILVLALPALADARARPRAFASCAGLVGYAERHLATTGGIPARPLLGAEPAPPPARPVGAAPDGGAATPTATEGAGPTYSTTNNQEEGVDEPDMVKTDGSTIFAVSGSRLEAVAVRGGAPRLAGTLELGADRGGGQLLLRGDRLLVISGGGGGVVPALAPLPFGARTVVTEVDVHDPAAMKVARTLTIDGSYVDARQNGSTARVVISSTPRAVADAATRDEPRGWVPARRFRSSLTGRHYVRPAAGCRAVRRPEQFSGLGMLTILTIDLDRGLWAADSDALMADAQVVYGSAGSLYVATQKWIDPQLAAARVPAAQQTAIHRFDVSDPDRTTLVASGEVEGYLLNQFSLSEHRGRLRVATTSRPIWWDSGAPPPPSESAVSVLERDGATLKQVGRVAGLGRGETIFSVRFLGDAGYVVTFRQVDPLYIVDLSTPTAPRVRGELEVPGVSTYLHPLGGGLLLGVGRDRADLQLSLFDVSDAASPKLLQRATMSGSSEAQYDHHAFLYWPATKLAVLPLESGAVGVRVDRGGLPEVGRVSHEPVDGVLWPIRRSVVIGDRVFTVSEGGALAADLGTLAAQGFVAFPNAAGSSRRDGIPSLR
jgi:uncharacterized secreted protein with C-terminal beta-propeller domain